MTTPVPWPAVWPAVAEKLTGHHDAGLTHLLTEDVVRFSTIQTLVDHGVPAGSLESEWRRGGVTDAVDLVVVDPPPAAIEFKFPREPRETNAAWTQHLGELLKDFYRLAYMPAEFGDRWCVQMLSGRVLRYLDSMGDKYRVRVAGKPGATTTLDPDAVRGLPATALGRLERWMHDPQPVTARCVGTYPAGGGSILAVHQVAPVTSIGDPPPRRH